MLNGFHNVCRQLAPVAYFALVRAKKCKVSRKKIAFTASTAMVRRNEKNSRFPSLNRQCSIAQRVAVGLNAHLESRHLGLRDQTDGSKPKDRTTSTSNAKFEAIASYRL